jgi:hypothetical protein
MHAAVHPGELLVAGIVDAPSGARPAAAADAATLGQ